MLSRLRWNKVLRDAWRHKARSVLVVLTIAVGVATFGMLLTARQAAQTSMDEGYWRNVPPGMILYTEPFGAETLDAVGDVPGVDQVEARKIVYGRVRAADSEQWLTLQWWWDCSVGRSERSCPSRLAACSAAAWGWRSSGCGSSTPSPTRASRCG